MGAKSDKFGAKAIPTVHMGYSTTQKGYRLYNTANKLIFVSRDVSFREDIFPFKSSYYQLRPPNLVEYWNGRHDPFVLETTIDAAPLETSSIVEPVFVPSSPSIPTSLNLGDSTAGVSENATTVSVPAASTDSLILSKAPYDNVADITVAPDS